jgi:hypothetical protein
MDEDGPDRDSNSPGDIFRPACCKATLNPSYCVPSLEAKMKIFGFCWAAGPLLFDQRAGMKDTEKPAT